MIVEGKGMVAPAPTRLALTDHDRRVLFDCAKQLDHYANATGGWRKGYCDPIEVPGLGKLTAQQAAIYTGKCGEFAVNELARRRFGPIVPPLDMERRPVGDGGADLTILGLDLQIKTRKSNEPVSLIKIENGWGKTLPLAGEASVFCVFPDPHGLIVSVQGWKWNRNLSDYSHVPARRGDHLNIEIPDADLTCIGRLWAELSARRGME